MNSSLKTYTVFSILDMVIVFKKLKNKLFFVLFFIISHSFNCNAQLKPEAMVLPIGFVGINDKSVKVILQQHVLTVLSESFELKSENEVIMFGSDFKSNSFD